MTVEKQHVNQIFSVKTNRSMWSSRDMRLTSNFQNFRHFVQLIIHITNSDNKIMQKKKKWKHYIKEVYYVFLNNPTIYTKPGKKKTTTTRF